MRPSLNIITLLLVKTTASGECATAYFNLLITKLANLVVIEPATRLVDGSARVMHSAELLFD